MKLNELLNIDLIDLNLDASSIKEVLKKWRTHYF